LQNHCLVIECEYKSILKSKQIIEKTLKNAIKKYPEDIGLQRWIVKMKNLFKEDAGQSSRPNEIGRQNEDDSSEDGNEEPPQEGNKEEKSTSETEADNNKDLDEEPQQQSGGKGNQTPKENHVLEEETQKDPHQENKTPTVPEDQSSTMHNLYTPTLDSPTVYALVDKIIQESKSKNLVPEISKPAVQTYTTPIQTSKTTFQTSQKPAQTSKTPMQTICSPPSFSLGFTPLFNQTDPFSMSDKGSTGKDGNKGKDDSIKEKEKQTKEKKKR